jgi:hypothetical protein
LGVIGNFPTATWQPMTGPRGSQSLSHVTSLHSHPATSLSSHVILPRVVWMPHHPATQYMNSTCPVRAATWKIFIGPQVVPKIPKMSDTWQPLVPPHHHVDVNMTHVTLFAFHICCKNDDVIHTDVDVSSMDADSSLLTRLG